MYCIETPVDASSASRYLQQLCKHWSHGLEVTHTPLDARVPLHPQAECLMHADEAGLDVRINAPDAGEAARLGRALVEHLQRFAGGKRSSRPSGVLLRRKHRSQLRRR